MLLFKGLEGKLALKRKKILLAKTGNQAVCVYTGAVTLVGQVRLVGTLMGRLHFSLAEATLQCIW